MQVPSCVLVKLTCIQSPPFEAKRAPFAEICDLANICNTNRARLHYKIWKFFREWNETASAWGQGCGELAEDELNDIIFNRSSSLLTAVSFVIIVLGWADKSSFCLENGMQLQHVHSYPLYILRFVKERKLDSQQRYILALTRVL